MTKTQSIVCSLRSYMLPTTVVVFLPLQLVAKFIGPVHVALCDAIASRTNEQLNKISP